MSKIVSCMSIFFSLVMLCMAAVPDEKNLGDFRYLQDHWNLDEGRDWHNMSFPFSEEKSLAYNSCQENDLQLIGLDPITSWVSGRQWSGIQFTKKGQLLKASKKIDSLKGDTSLSYWIRLRGNVKNGVVVGDPEEMEWGAILNDGRLAVRQNGTLLVATRAKVTDEQWHHVVILRQAKTGKIALYLDGKFQASATGIKGLLKGAYLGFGAAENKRPFIGILDQIHIFSKPIKKDTIQVLFTNHAPKAYDQDAIITRGVPSKTGSMLHLYTFDPDQDEMSIARFGQGKFGVVKSNGDGTFTYLAGKNFTGNDSFPVVITDGHGGFSRANVMIRDENSVSRLPVAEFTNCLELGDVGNTGEHTNYRNPAAYDWNGDKVPDLLVVGNNRLWAYENKNGHFSPTPALVKNENGEDIKATAAVVLPGKKIYPNILIRTKNGQLDVYGYVKNRPELTFKKIETLKNSLGSEFLCKSNCIAVGDFNNDGKADLLTGEGGGIFLYRNVGNNKLVFSSEREQVIHGSYNLAPYFGDLNADGKMDFMHGINWGSIHFWINKGGNSILENSSRQDIRLTTADGTPVKHKNKGIALLRYMDGTLGTLDDFNQDGVTDVVLGGWNGQVLLYATGVNPNEAAGNLAKIEKIYEGHENDLGRHLEANNQKLLNEYKFLNRQWIIWARSLPTSAERENAYNQLKAHVKKYPFLKRGVQPAGIKRDKDNKITEIGPMHHVPGIVVMNWITLHCLMPDSAAHRVDVADTLGLTGLDREQYLRSGVAVADNSKCSDGQMLAITDFMTYHPRVLFPDDHISIDQNMGDGRDAMSYVFRSNKNTFGCNVGGAVCESAGDLKKAAEKYLGPGSATGDYFTLVMGHEICHSLDAYVYGRKNKDLMKRWYEMLIFAANNAGENNILVSSEDGWYDLKKTQARFIEKGLWDGKEKWKDAWDNYWKKCPYNGLTFMRGNTGWFLAARQETLATQGNHHWAGSEARIVGAIDRFNRGYKANINEVVHFIDILSAGLNKLPMYKFRTEQTPVRRVYFDVDHAWLERNNSGYITKITIQDRVYQFKLDDRGRVRDIIFHPFMEEMKKP